MKLENHQDLEEGRVSYVELKKNKTREEFTNWTSFKLKGVALWEA